VYDALDIWLLAIGTAASAGTPNYHCFTEKIQGVCAYLHLTDFHDVLTYIRSICWLGGSQGEDMLRPHWNVNFVDNNQLGPAEVALDLSPNSFGVQYLRNKPQSSFNFADNSGLFAGLTQRAECP
jgi:hypothetical protein